MSQDDEDDVGRCLGGERDAFRGLVGRHEGPLIRYLTGQSGRGDLAVEVAQEDFVRAYFALSKLQSPALFRPWLLGIAERVMKETLRAKRRSAVALSVVTASGRASPAFDSLDDEGSEREGALNAAVAELPELYREVVLLRFHAGLSCVQIADKLNVSTGTVTSRLSRAYALLRQALRDSHLRLGLEHDAEAPR
ncbi:MAG: sigma-70 family RNA polymerase sigma factor [Paludisphaera borealis]|uniref:RNA polymerase sigma factor n=1 Tax=Paludisphaera borealis TaxID=1387353 RepID=UPI0028413EAD|nr:sigma-70 family RNA polymerase sigma factor [Paludisphaera borealis]MDR3619454.1 sigma-70 family RNA polymerase sigma factor [Paludisphaera borealis]